jgi:hypothetical protein
MVLVKWVRFKHVPRLDSAFCNRESRERYLTLAYHPATIFAGAMNHFMDYTKLKSIFQWVVTRKAQLDGVLVDDHLQQYLGVLFKFLTISGLGVRWVSITSKRPDATRFSQLLLLEMAESCPNIQKLTVQVGHTVNVTTLWDESLTALTKSCRKLTDLSIINALLSEQGLAAALYHCERIRTLSIHTQDQMISVGIATPTLTSITCGSRFITDGVLVASGLLCRSLRKLKVFSSAQYVGSFCVTDAGVRAVLQGCPLLRETDVDYAKGISHSLRVELARRRDVTTLCTPSWRGMDDDLAQGVLRVSPNLTKLRCEDRCEWLTDDTLAVCAQHCTQVTEITIVRCPLVTDSGLRVLVSSLARTLRYVGVGHCDQLRHDTLLAVAEHCSMQRN